MVFSALVGLAGTYLASKKDGNKQVGVHSETSGLDPKTEQIVFGRGSNIDYHQSDSASARSKIKAINFYRQSIANNEIKAGDPRLEHFNSEASRLESEVLAERQENGIVEFGGLYPEIIDAYQSGRLADKSYDQVDQASKLYRDAAGVDGGVSQRQKVVADAVNGNYGKNTNSYLGGMKKNDVLTGYINNGSDNLKNSIDAIVANEVNGQNTAWQKSGRFGSPAHQGAIASRVAGAVAPVIQASDASRAAMAQQREGSENQNSQSLAAFERGLANDQLNAAVSAPNIERNDMINRAELLNNSAAAEAQNTPTDYQELERLQQMLGLAGSSGTVTTKPIYRNAKAEALAATSALSGIVSQAEQNFAKSKGA